MGKTGRGDKLGRIDPELRHLERPRPGRGPTSSPPPGRSGVVRAGTGEVGRFAGPWQSLTMMLNPLKQSRVQGALEPSSILHAYWVASKINCYGTQVVFFIVFLLIFFNPSCRSFLSKFTVVRTQHLSIGSLSPYKIQSLPSLPCPNSKFSALQRMADANMRYQVLSAVLTPHLTIHLVSFLR